MGLWARLVYSALAWKERRRARATPFSAGEEQDETELQNLGLRGETLAYWYLRRAGYTVVARNWRPRSGRGELDLVAREGPVLAFVEVKTRISAATGPPEESVSPIKQERVVRAAREYLRQLRGKPVTCRFDVVSVSVHPKGGLEVRLIRDAFQGC
jgi:putative endonuclease